MLENRTLRGRETAVVILRILVERVLADDGEEITITYGDLADQLPPSLSYLPRKLGYPLGCLEEMLEKISEQWEEEIPLIQGLVLRKDEDLPGDNFCLFRDRGLTLSERRMVFAAELETIRNYPRWLEVLAELESYF